MTTISHWGTDPLCTIGRFNEQPMVTLWNTLVRFKDAEFRGEKPLLYLLQQVEQNNLLDDFLLWSGTNNTNPAYESRSIKTRDDRPDQGSKKIKIKKDKERQRGCRIK